MATEYLIQMGHKSIMGLFRNRYKDSAFRAAGYLDAMEQAGLQAHILDADATSEDDWVSYITDKKITAIICYNDLLAVECYHCLNRAGIRIGEDVSIVGYDNTELSDTATVTHPKDMMAERAASFLLDWINGNAAPPYQFLFQPELIKRDSVRRLHNT